ncbi:hypothetical protein [Mycobacterium sp. C31M]
MDLMWWAVPIAACLGLAGAVGMALLWPGRTPLRPPRALANIDRLTGLPEYKRAARLQAISTAVTIGLLVLAFVAMVVAAARPTGLPAPQREAAADQPEDIMVCIGGSDGDPEVQAALRYFADEVRDFTTERIGLSSADRRVIPLTRDYQYAAATFAQPGPLAPRVDYADYTPNVADTLALCLTGFPRFDAETAQRRSIIYVGPGATPNTATLFTDDAVRTLAREAGVQVNAVTSGAGLPGALAEATGGRAFTQTSDTATRLVDIRRHPPASAPDADGVAARSPETPELAVLAALLAIAGVLILPVVIRR